MAKKILIVKNITHEGPGLLETLLCEHGIAWHSEDLSAGGTFPDPRGYSALVVLGGPQSANDESPAMLLQLRRIEQALHEEFPSLCTIREEYHSTGLKLMHNFLRLSGLV